MLVISLLWLELVVEVGDDVMVCDDLTMVIFINCR